MSKRKLLLAVISICIFILISSASYAQSVGEADVLEGLGIINITESQYIKYDDFVTGVIRMIIDEEVNGDNLSELKSIYGLGDKNTQSSLTVEEACKIALSALGYGKATANIDCYSKASEIGLLKGVSSSKTQKLTQKDAVSLLYNLMDTNVYKTEYSGGVLSYKASNENILEAGRKIYRINGIITTNDQTSITGVTAVGDKQAKIGDVLCFDEKRFANKLIGCNVTAYVKINDGDYHILYMYEKNNDIITVDSRNIESVSDDYSMFSYYQDDFKRKSKNIKLSRPLKVLYNGQFYGDYTIDDLIPHNGSVTAIDNNADGKYDVVKITDYRIMVVDRVSGVSSTVYGKYRYDGALQSIDLSDDGECEINIIKDGKNISVTDIKEWDVLNILATKEKENGRIEVTVSSNKETVEVSSVSFDDDVLEINDNKYISTYDYIKEYEYTSTEDNAVKGDTAKKIEVGKQYILLFDCQGRIAGGYTDSNEYVYFLMVKMYYDEDSENSVHVVGLDMDDKERNYLLKEKVKYNGLRISANECYKQLRGDSSSCAQLLQVKFAGSDIKEIRTAIVSDVPDESAFIKSTHSGTYRYTVKTFENTVYLEDDAKVITVPTTLTRNVDDYSVANASVLSTDTGYNFTAYNMDEYGFTDMILIALDTVGKNERYEVSTDFYVKSIFSACRDDDIVQGLTGYVSGYGDITVYSTGCDTFSELKPGDMVHLSVNDDGRVFYAKKMISVDNLGGKSNETNIYTSRKIYIYGYVLNLDAAKQRIRLDCNGINTLNLTGTGVIIYHKKNKQYENASISDIDIGDFVYCGVSWSKIPTIYIVRDE